MIIANIVRQQALEVAFIEGNNVIEQVPPATLDPALSNSVLPGTLERRANRPDGHGAYRDRDLQTIFGVPIKDEEPRSRLIREGLAQLLDDPTGGRMGRNVEIHDTPPIVADDEEAIEHTEGYGRNGKEVHRRDGFPVISKKGKPAFCWLRVSRRSFHPAGNRSFRDIETEHEKFAVNTWGAPGGVLRDHPKEQIRGLPWKSFSGPLSGGLWKLLANTLQNQIDANVQPSPGPL